MMRAADGSRSELLLSFLEFSWITQYADFKHLSKLARADPTFCAEWCWDNQCVPVSPRFGFNLQKPLHKQLVNHSSLNERAYLIKKVKSHYGRVLSETESKELVPIMIMTQQQTE